jgi:hypothetical protein
MLTTTFFFQVLWGRGALGGGAAGDTDKQVELGPAKSCNKKDPN